MTVCHDLCHTQSSRLTTHVTLIAHQSHVVCHIALMAPVWQVERLRLQLPEGLEKNRRLRDHIFNLQGMLGVERRLPEV